MSESYLSFKKQDAIKQPDKIYRHPLHRLLVNPIMRLQSIIGNRTLLRLLKAQAKLTVSHPDDMYEKEADRVADQVMRMPEAQVQRQPNEEEEKIPQKSPAETMSPLMHRQVAKEEEPLQTKGDSEESQELRAETESQIDALQGKGASLSDSVRSFMEPRFGVDFSNVRVHTDGDASDTAHAVNAQAFTVGRDIIFSAGYYTPESESGKKLLAHELTHVVQQSRTESLPQDGIALRQAAPTPPADTGDFALDKKWPSGVEFACSGGPSDPSNAIVENSNEYKALQTSSNADIVFANTNCKQMTSNLKDETDALATKVKAKWPTVKLKINSAYRNLSSEPYNYHKLARAADLATDPFDSAKLGHLAKLASESGFSWVWYENVNHVHASVKKDE